MHTRNYEEYEGKMILAPYMEHEKRKRHINSCVTAGLQKEVFKDKYVMALLSLVL